MKIAKMCCDGRHSEQLVVCVHFIKQEGMRECFLTFSSCFPTESTGLWCFDAKSVKMWLRKCNCCTTLVWSNVCCVGLQWCRSVGAVHAGYREQHSEAVYSKRTIINKSSTLPFATHVILCLNGECACIFTQQLTQQICGSAQKTNWRHLSSYSSP